MKNRKAAIEIPIILGLAAIAMAGILVSKSLVQNTIERAPLSTTETKQMEIKPTLVPPQIQPERGILPEQRIEKETGVMPEKRMIEQPMPPEKEEGFVDQREINDVLRQTKDIKREVKRILTQAKKLANLAQEVAKLNELVGLVDKLVKDIQTPPAEMTKRDVLQDFYDEQVWDQVNEIRMKVEFPKEVKNLEKELVKAEKLLKLKAVQKIKAEVFAAAKIKLAEIRANIEEAKAKYQAGEMEEARDALQFIYEDGNPGEVSCILYAFRDAFRDLPRVKDAEIKQLIEGILEPIVDAIKDGDFRYACQGINEIRNEVQQVMQRVLRLKKVLDPKIKERLQKLEQIMEEKFEKLELEEKPELKEKRIE